MEVVIPVSGMSTPSSPRGFGHYFFTSAPTSPTRMSEFYREFDNFYMFNESRGSRRSSLSSSAVPFDWEEKPGTPKSPKSKTFDEDDFAFDVSGELKVASLSAEELFDGGKIRPLKPPPRLQHDEYISQKSPLLSPRSPKSPRSPISQGRRIIREAFSPRTKKEIDPFETAIENTRKRSENNQRGRDRTVQGLSTSSSRRATRSLSPLRVSAFPWDEEDQKQQQQKQQQQQQPTKQSSFSLNTSKGSSRKWRLRDFLLFRSASEGRAKGKDPFSKYASFFRKNDDSKNASIRSTDSSGSGSGSRRRGPVSAHELHYTKNKAASEDLKKRTFLPYKQGILGSWVSHTFKR